MVEKTISEFFTVSGTDIEQQIRTHFTNTHSEAIVLSCAPIFVSADLQLDDFIINGIAATLVKVIYVIVPKVRLMSMAKVFRGEVEALIED